MADALSIQAEIIEPLAGSEPDLRDSADQAVLGTLRAAIKTTGANYLITGNNDLLALAERYPIVPPALFWAMHAVPDRAGSRGHEAALLFWFTG